MTLDCETANVQQPPVLRIAATPEDVSACFSLMLLLRPHLQDAHELVARWRIQQKQNYNLLIAWNGDCAVGLAGYRYQTNLLHGAHLYVDDLVTSDRNRRNRHGSLRLNHLKSVAKARELRKLAFDAALGNALGHRFYFRNGFLARGLYFWAELEGEPNVEST